MSGLKKTLALLILVLTCTECGRKQRTLFHFPEKESITLNKLTLPTPRGLNITIRENKVLLTWQPVALPKINDTLPDHMRLLGYNVYRFVKGRFISNHPITKRPVHETEYLDSSPPENKHQFCYMIRAVFDINNHIVQGPASHIATINALK